MKKRGGGALGVGVVAHSERGGLDAAGAADQRRAAGEGHGALMGGGTHHGQAEGK